MTEDRAPEALWSAGRATCPPWCVTAHGVHLGEEDWVHLGEPLPLAEGISAQLCMSIDPLSGVEDGPYIIIGGTEYTLPAAKALATSLMALATTR
jgi:hypothetical protein